MASADAQALLLAHVLDAGLVAGATKAGAVEATKQARDPGLHAVGIIQLVGIQGRQLDHRLQQRGIETVRQTTHRFLGGNELLHQGFQAFTADRRRVRGVAQLRPFDRVVDQVGIQRRIVLQIELALALLDLV